MMIPEGNPNLYSSMIALLQLYQASLDLYIDKKRSVHNLDLVIVPVLSIKVTAAALRAGAFLSFTLVAEKV
jgi:hypothetical protein